MTAPGSLGAGVEREGHTAPMQMARAFGTSLDDLEVDFAEPRRPFLITEILERCLYEPRGSHYAQSEIWHWSLQRRLRGLIAIARAGAEERAPVLQRCVEEACGETMEIEINLASLAEEPERNALEWEPEPGTKLLVGLPTGDDQLRWLGDHDPSPASLYRRMATTLVRAVNGKPVEVGWEIPEDWLEPLAVRLQEHDPINGLSVDCHCPVCGVAASVELDVEQVLLDRFEARQRRLLREIHVLASLYHWSEAEIMAVAPWRRAIYLRQAAEGLA